MQGCRTSFPLAMASAKTPPTEKSEESVFRSVISLFLHPPVLRGGGARLEFPEVAIAERPGADFAAYTQLLDFDPDFTPYYYTLGRELDEDTWLVVDLYASASSRSPLRSC